MAMSETMTMAQRCAERAAQLQATFELLAMSRFGLTAEQAPVYLAVYDREGAKRGADSARVQATAMAAARAARATRLMAKSARLRMAEVRS
jgi:hypothetical protein